MKYYAFIPTRSIRYRKAVELMYPDAIIIDRFPFDSYFEECLTNEDILIMSSIIDTFSSDDDSSTFKNFLSLYEKGINVEFEETPQCNSSVIKYLSTNCNISPLCLLQIQFMTHKKLSQYSYDIKTTMMKIAKNEGKQIGRKKGTKLTTKKLSNAKNMIIDNSKDFNGSLNDKEVMELIGLSKNTYYKYKKELKNEKN